jgi:Flp pilus assembly protein TadD
MLRSADPDDGRGSDFTVRQLLDDFAGRAGSEELASQPEVEAAVRTAIGAAYRRIGDVAKAQPHLERALTLERGLHGDGHEAVAQSLVELAWNQGEQGHLGEAEATARRAVQILR